MKKILLGLLLIVATIAVSCSQDSATQEDLVSIRFTKLEAKAIDETVYSVDTDATWGGASVQIGNVGDYFWTYKATKQDATFTTGQTDGFEDWSTDKGLSGSKKFSSGSWKFELKAYASAEDRTNRATEDKAVFTGEATTGKLTSTTTVPVSMAFTYVTGQGSVNLTVTATISQPDKSTSAITSVKMVIGEKTVTLSKNDTSWTGTGSEIPSGKQKVKIEVYVDDETEARLSKEIGTAYILHGMTTNVTGSATITLTGDKEVDVSFNADVPELPTQAPTDTKAGDTLTLGKLPDSETSITWKVLTVENGEALIISEKALKLMGHTNNATDTYSWADSNIKSWLNDTSENGFISQYGLENVSIADGDAAVGNIFLLSKGEAELYGCTASVAYVGDNQDYGLWLRTADSLSEQSAVMINPNALQILSVTDVKTGENELGVRPAFWIDIK